MKRTVEVFTAGCPVCSDAVRLVQSVACPSCTVQVLDLHTDTAALARARELGIRRVPAVVVNGALAECCRGGAVDAAALRAAGVGVPL